MKLKELLKLLNSDIRRELIIHFYSCECHQCDVNHLINMVKSNQANVSKHLKMIYESGLIKCKNFKTKKMYYMPAEAKNKFSNLFEEVLKIDLSLNKFICSCSIKH